MSTQAQERVTIRQLPTGVPGLDEILSGGLPEYSFNIIAGAPGCGKTTLAHQIVFANAGPQCPALYFTVLGEPAIKMLRYQQQFQFFDQTKMDGAIRFVNLSNLVLEKDLGAVLDAIIREVEASNAKIVVVDSFRTVVRKTLSTATEVELQGFIQRLALHLTSWQATTFLIGEYVEGELRDNPVFTVADGLLWLYQSIEQNSIVRKMQVMKMRGQQSVPGMHTFRITEHGMHCFPRTFGLSARSSIVKGVRRLSTGVRELDALMDGGIPEGDSLLLAGPSGAGKTVLGIQFIADGLRHSEPGIVPMFEENLSKFTVSFLADDILRLRYVSINGQLRKMLLVVKMRRSLHSIDMCEYQVSPKGLVIGQPLRGFRALTSGIPGPWPEAGENDPDRP